MGNGTIRRTLGWMMITLGLLFFILRTPLPFDILMPGVTTALIGLLILVFGRRAKRIS